MTAEEDDMAYELPKLPYPYDALEPHIDARTMEIHHTKHHKAYVDKVNAALQGHAEFQNMSIDDLMANMGRVPEAIRNTVVNNGGGHANHSMFWTIMGPNKGGQPKGALGDAIGGAFGSFDKFKDAFKKEALDRFGSGWAWLVKRNGRLLVMSTPNQNNPRLEGDIPILGIDVWEHAYYLKYQNRRPDYVDAWWNVVDWDSVGRVFDKAR